LTASIRGSWQADPAYFGLGFASVTAWSMSTQPRSTRGYNAPRATPPSAGSCARSAASRVSRPGADVQPAERRLWGRRGGFVVGSSRGLDVRAHPADPTPRERAKWGDEGIAGENLAPKATSGCQPPAGMLG
jgi:hypothetical protein